MALNVGTDFADMVASTLYELGPIDVVQQIAQKKQNYEVLSRWFKKDKVELDSGIAIQRQLMVADTGAARHAAPTAEDNVNLADILKNIVVPWVHADTSWMVIYQQTLMNRSPSMILNAIKAQRNGSMLSLYDEMENKAWADAPPSTDKENPWAVKYWVVQNATAGFNGGSPTGDNLIAGLNLTTLSNSCFNNYSGTYGTVSPTDLMPKMRTAHRKTGFISPIDIKDYMTGTGDDYRVYVNEATLAGMEDIAMAQGDLGIKDIASVDGMTLSFRNNPIRWVAALDAAANNPVYMLNHSCFYPVGLQGDNLRESRSTAPKNHNIEQYFVDLTYNFLCVDRRRQAVLYAA